MTFLAGHYDLLRGLHILAVIAWMTGMLYLPRLFAYHSRAARGSEMDRTFQEMELRFLRIIVNPAMGLAFIFGFWLIHLDVQMRGAGFLAQPWMIAKLVGVVLLFGWHGYLSAERKRVAAGTSIRTAKFWRMTNEIPFLLAIVMVLSVTTEWTFG